MRRCGIRCQQGLRHFPRRYQAARFVALRFRLIGDFRGVAVAHRATSGATLFCFSLCLARTGCQRLNRDDRD